MLLLVRPGGFEPLAFRVGAERSIPVSYTHLDVYKRQVYIRRLRMKIEDDPGKPQMLLTVRGMGYKWNG